MPGLLPASTARARLSAPPASSPGVSPLQTQPAASSGWSSPGTSPPPPASSGFFSTVVKGLTAPPPPATRGVGSYQPTPPPPISRVTYTASPSGGAPGAYFGPPGVAGAPVQSIGAGGIQIGSFTLTPGLLLLLGVVAVGGYFVLR